MKFSAEEGLSPDYTGGSHLLCLLPLDNVDIKPRTPEVSVLIQNLEVVFLPCPLHVNAFSISVLVYFV